MLGISTTNVRVGGFRGKGIDSDATTIYNRIIADGGVSDLTRLNFFVKGLKTIYGSLTNVPVCYDAHWIGYKLGSGTGATAGQAAAKLYSLTVAGDSVQTTAASQPLLLSHNGASTDNYLFSSGVTGNNCTTSTNNNFEVSGNWTIDFNVSDLVVNGEYISKGNSSNGFVIFLNAGVVRYTYFSAGVRTVDLTSNAIDLVTQKWCRIQRNGFNYAWFTSTDGITFTQVGSNVVDIVTTASIAAPLRVGQGVNFFASPCVIKTYRAKFYNDATQTTLITDFNPATYNAATSQTAWTSATGEVWTINTGTADGYKGLLVDRTYLQGDGVDDVMIASGLSSRQYYSSYVATRIQTFSGTVRGIFGSLAQANLIYVNTTVDVRGYGLGILQYAGEVNNRFQLFTANFELLAGSVLTNNANKVSGALGGSANTTAYVLSDGSTGFGNFVFSTGIQSNATDSIATNTATYNLIRSLNNNAF